MATVTLGPSGTGLRATDLDTKVGRAALATQGALYLVVGVLAARLALGDRSAEPSQKGALEELAGTSFGKVALAVVLVGLVAHVAWRVMLAVRGEPGQGDDGSSVAKRIANGARAAVYAGFAVVAVKLLAGSGGSSGSSGSSEKQSTATVLDWPGGPALVVAAGLCVIGAGGWNAWKGVTRRFTDSLDLGSASEPVRRAVVVAGTAGYLGRGAAFAAVGWFFLEAGLDHDPDSSGGMDHALRELAEASYGQVLLLAVALGLVLFGCFRIADARYRRPDELTHA